MSKILRDAERYEEIMGTTVPEEKRPGFHLTARIGWMNDPNGFSYYKDRFHLFFQYYPYSCTWGPMYWGHAVTDDLLHWQYRPVALAPDCNADRDGCFSGTAINLPDGRHMLLYTGVANEFLPSGKKRGVQSQCIAFGDGESYKKYPANPVLTHENIPAIYSRYDFRDPKIWRAEDGTFRSLIAACTITEQDGHLLLFSSPDGIRWKFEKTLVRNNGRFGKMWECPDLFELDGTQVLLISPQDMIPLEEVYYNGNGTVCLLGDYDAEAQSFDEKSHQPIDQGIDFYAPQTVLSPDGRRIMIGWMQNWDTIHVQMPDLPWFGQMNLPRELSVANGKLIQKPVREITSLRRNPIIQKDILFKNTIELPGVRGRQIDLDLEIEPESPDQLFEEFTVFFAQNSAEKETRFSFVRFNPEKSRLTIDRTFSGSRRGFVHQRSARVNHDHGKIRLRLILDRFSAEIFVNGGEQVLSMTLFTEQDADRISFHCDSSVRLSVEKYDLLKNETI